MTIRIHTTATRTTLRFETARGGGTTPRMWAQRAMTPSTGRSPSTTPSVWRGGSALYDSRLGVAVLRVQQHGEEMGDNQRRRDVGSGRLGQHRNHRNPIARPQPMAGRDHRHYRAVNVGVDHECVDQMWVGYNREPEVGGCADILLLTDSSEVP